MLQHINSALEILCPIINWAGRLPSNRIKLSPVRGGVLIRQCWGYSQLFLRNYSLKKKKMEGNKKPIVKFTEKK